MVNLSDLQPLLEIAGPYATAIVVAVAIWQLGLKKIVEDWAKERAAAKREYELHLLKSHSETESAMTEYAKYRLQNVLPILFDVNECYTRFFTLGFGEKRVYEENMYESLRKKRDEIHRLKSCFQRLTHKQVKEFDDEDPSEAESNGLFLLSALAPAQLSKSANLIVKQCDNFIDRYCHDGNSELGQAPCYNGSHIEFKIARLLLIRFHNSFQEMCSLFARGLEINDEAYIKVLEKQGFSSELIPLSRSPALHYVWHTLISENVLLRDSRAMNYLSVSYGCFIELNPDEDAWRKADRVLIPQESNLSLFFRKLFGRRRKMAIASPDDASWVVPDAGLVYRNHYIYGNTVELEKMAKETTIRYRSWSEDFDCYLATLGEDFISFY